MNPLMERLHDIEGIDPVSWWPPGIGWWAVIACALILTISFAVYFYQRLAFKRSWKNDALQQLHALERNLTESTAKESAVLLSEYLRRMAVKLYTRNDCAGLVGTSWLKWLSSHDPKRFDWESKGRSLIEAPYAPETVSPSVKEIKVLIQAAKRWVR